ncbi:MAG TPA: phasin family protein [Gammaproteobacteria bacterium]|nr:phasin family protein [Gammaproteobacteria bacterium]
MRRRMRTAMDVAVGAAASGWESLQRRTERYAERGRSRREQFRDRVEEETSAWKETSRHQAEWLEERVREEVHRVLHRAHLVTREDYDALERQLQQVRQRLADVESRTAGPGESAGPEDGA